MRQFGNYFPSLNSEDIVVSSAAFPGCSTKNIKNKMRKTCLWALTPQCLINTPNNEDALMGDRTRMVSDIPYFILMNGRMTSTHTYIS